jgi:acetoin utilization deacetylase AcuC-like enzyme
LAQLPPGTFSSISCDAATIADVAAVHTERHIAAVESMSAGGGGWFDADTYCTADSYRAALLAAGAAVAAADVAGSGQHAFAITRPPGHHAGAGRAMGFCLFNNIVIAARHLQAAGTAGKIAIVDVDVHHGNGTEELVAGDPSILYVSLHQWPHYPMSGGPGSSHDNILNIPLDAGTGDGEWLQAFDGLARPAIQTFAPEMVMVSCGFDTLGTDPLAGFDLTPGVYGAMAQRIVALAAAPTVWCLEGGYDPAAIARAACTVVETLAGA